MRFALIRATSDSDYISIVPLSTSLGVENRPLSNDLLDFGSEQIILRKSMMVVHFSHTR